MPCLILAILATVATAQDVLTPRPNDARLDGLYVPVDLGPLANETPTPGSVKKTIPTPTGNLYLIQTPLGKSIAQDFKERLSLDLDITKPLRLVINLPDPNRFQLRPLGPPSGVRIYAMTLERASIQMEVTIPEKTLYLKEYAPAPRPEIYLKDLMVTYEPVEKVFAAQ
ncbi:MAG: hypothetical protein HY360_06830 [Verrucomicrobia bacterium]|nr:hypothetical protein [Verrucomicrobiota bacterium]